MLFASVMTRPDTHTAAVALQVFGATQEGGAIPVYWQMMAAALVCARRSLSSTSSSSATWSAD